jgi:two-component system NtrC family sensor kinase
MNCVSRGYKSFGRRGNQMNDSQPLHNILIVDDDAPIQKILSKILSGCGYQCAVAANAAEAGELLKNRKFDVMLTDLEMPGESGIELAQAVKQTHPDMAVVIVSVITDPQTAAALLELGVFGYIVKPFERSQVIITIKNALIRRELELKARDKEQQLEATVQHKTKELSKSVKNLTIAKSKLAATAKKQKDQLLFMQTLLDAIPSPLYYKDSEGIYLGCNNAFETYTGFDRSDIIGKKAHAILKNEYADRYQIEDKKLLENAGKQSYEDRVEFSDGSIREVFFSKAAYSDSSGDVAGLVGVMVDITETKQKERELCITQEKNKIIVENIGMGVAVVDTEMNLLETNQLMEHWFPGTKAAGCSKCYEIFIDPPRNSPCGPCPTKKTLSDGRVHETVLQLKYSDKPRDIKITSSAILDNDGKIVAAIELVNDITKELAMEREFLQSQKLASIGQLAAGVAHEINNPTGFVSSNLMSLLDYQNHIIELLEQYQTLKGTVKDIPVVSELPSLQQMIATIETTEKQIEIDYICQDTIDLIGECREGTERIKKIVEDLKHFAHPGQDTVQDTDLNRELTSTLNVVNNELKYKAHVSTEFGDLPIIRANPQQLNQVFVNILVNAAQAIEGMGEIRIKTEALDKFIEISISDTGCGIPEENVARIFDPFFTTKEVGKGTGLGMNIAYNIIMKHRGSIKVDSRVGEGTTFIIQLPTDLEDKQHQNSAMDAPAM